MTVNIFQPQISVTLRKNIGRATVAGSIAASERFTGAAREIDLTPYLGEFGGVVTSKSIREAAGSFSITLADQMTPREQESLYGLIEPMDVVEIRFARDPARYHGSLDAGMPMVMRGFVTEPRRTTAMTERGPQRAVTILGHDYGKILQMMQIAYLPNYVLGQNLLTYFKFFMNYNGAKGQLNFKDASVFVAEIVSEIINPFIADMRRTATGNGVAQGISPVMDLGVDASVQKGVVSPYGTNTWPGGTIYDMLTYFGDVGPWNELFIDDREDGPYLVYRPVPFKDVSGNYIQEPYISDVSRRPATGLMTDDEVVEEGVGRSDAGVYNYYWVDAPNYQLVDGRIYQSALARSNDFFLKDYPNSSPFLYGLRKLEVHTQQGARFDGAPEAEYRRQAALGYAFASDRRQTLIDNNKDNVVFEDGNVAFRGDESIKPGMFVTRVKGAEAASIGSQAMISEFYAVRVTHRFLPFRNFTTAVDFERGTGFINRIQRASSAASPYLSEMNVRGAYG